VDNYFWAVGAPPRTPLCELTVLALAGGEGLLPPPQEPHPGLGLRPFGVAREWRILDTPLRLFRRL